MEFERDIKVFQEIEAALRNVPEDVVFFDDAQTEEDILAAITKAQAAGEGGRRTTQEWRTQVVRCRTQYLYAAFTFYGTNVRMRSCQTAKEALKELIVLFREQGLNTARLERRLGQIREAMLIALERGATE